MVVRATAVLRETEERTMAVKRKWSGKWCYYEINACKKYCMPFNFGTLIIYVFGCEQ